MTPHMVLWVVELKTLSRVLWGFSSWDFWDYKVPERQGKASTRTMQFTSPSYLLHILAHDHFHTANTNPAAEASPAAALIVANISTPARATRTSHLATDATAHATNAAALSTTYATSHSTENPATYSTTNAAACSTANADTSTATAWHSTAELKNKQPIISIPNKCNYLPQPHASSTYENNLISLSRHILRVTAKHLSR